MDVEQFIELVRKRPCLYDCRNGLSKNKKEKEKTWKEIADTMEITSELAKSKWKNLKDNYCKHLKGATAISGQYLKYLHWTWAPNMEFMKKHINIPTPTNNLDHHNQEDHEMVHIDSAWSSSKSEDTFEEFPIGNNTELQIHARQGESKHNSKIFQCIENGQDNEYDGTDLIFLGYAKAIKAFSIRRQAEIKLRIAKIITDEEVANYEENSMHPESPLYSHASSPQMDPLNSKNVHEIRIKYEEI